MNKRVKQIICIVLAVLLVLLLVIPVFAEEITIENSDGSKTTTTETHSEKEEYDENTNTTVKEITEDVHITTEMEEKPPEKPTSKDDYDTDDPVEKYEAHNQPGREETAYDDYVDFDTLMQKTRGSTYYFDGKNEYDVVTEKGGATVTFIIHHIGDNGGGDASKYFVYDNEGRKLSSGVKYFPNEMEITVYNVPEGQKIKIEAYTDNYLDGVFITQKSEGTYRKGHDPLDSVLEVYGDFNVNEEVNRSLLYKDAVTLEDMEYLLSTYPRIPNGSLLKRPGVAEAFIRAQDEYGVSALALLALGCLESAWGTSHIAVDKQNLFGWGAVDSNPYDGAWDWSGKDTSEAVYTALSLICKNYPCGKYGQDTFYSMRYNDNRHQYCTSTTWPYSNTTIRAQFEQYLGLR